MSIWEFITFVRFEAFPFIEDSLKHHPIRLLLEMDVQHSGFPMAIHPLIETNQFTRFCKILSHMRHRRILYEPQHGLDLEVLEQLFWEESHPPLARRILATFIRFPHMTRPSESTIGTNLMLRSRTREEKESALTFMDAFIV